MKTDKELKDMSYEEVVEESSKYWEYVRKCDKIADVKKLGLM